MFVSDNRDNFIYPVIWFKPVPVIVPCSSIMLKSNIFQAAIMAELLGSGKASEQLLQIYFPFGVFALLAILRGLFYRPRRATSTSHASSSRKKRA